MKKEKILGILMLLALVCFSPVVVNASPAGWEPIEYLLVLEPLLEPDYRYFGRSDDPYAPHKVLQIFTQSGEVFVNEDGEVGDYLGTIELEVFYLIDLPLLKGIAIAQFTMLLGEDTVKGVAEVRLTLEIVGEQVLQNMTGRFSGHGDRNMHGTVRDNAKIGDQVILEGYAK